MEADPAGLGPWARIYRPAHGGRRQCVQLCIPSWHALDDRAWGHADQLEPAELARVLGVYAARVQYRIRRAEEAMGYPVQERRTDLDVALLAVEHLGSCC